jgi:hypothetical protein
MITEDKDLAEIIREVAEELHVDIQLVERVYYHYIGMLYRLMTAVKYRYLTTELKRKHAVNVSIPGFGRILHRYGKTYGRRKDKDSTDDSTDTGSGSGSGTNTTD